MIDRKGLVYSIVGAVLGAAIAYAVMSLGAARTSHLQSPRLPVRVMSATEAQKALDDRVELILAYQEAFLDTIYWSLGGAVTVGFLLVGLSWFTSNSIHERDKAALREELLARAAAIQAEAKGNAEAALSRLAALREEMRVEAAKSSASTKKAIQADMEKMLNEGLKVGLSGVRSDVRQIKFDMAKAEAEASTTRPEWSVYLYCECLLLGARDTGVISAWEGDIVDSLGAAIGRCTSIGADDLARIAGAAQAFSKARPTFAMQLQDLVALARQRSQDLSGR